MKGGPGRQLPLALELAPRFGEDDFLVTPANEAAHRWIARWPDWPARGLLLVGPPGAGKSHLAAIWAARAGTVPLPARDMREDLLRRAAPDTAVAVENIDDPGVSEHGLFHVLNTVRETGAWLLATARRAPDLAWPVLPDLASRLRALPCAELEPPDDMLLRAVLVKLFDDRQLAVDAGVIDYAVRRMERSLAAARFLVAALDREALARGRRVTRAMAADILAGAGAQPPGEGE